MKKLMAVLAAAALACALVSCSGRAASRPEEKDESDQAFSFSGGARVLTVGVEDAGETVQEAAMAVSTVINNRVPGVRADVERSKGSPVIVTDLQAGEIDLGLVSGDAAYFAYNGEAVFAGNRQEKIRAIAGCYPSLSQWIALEGSGLEYVHDLKGKDAAAGSPASVTELASSAAFSAMGIGGENTAIWNLSLRDGAEAVGDGFVSSAHAFAGVLEAGYARLSETADIRLLKYTGEELDQIVGGNGAYYRAAIPAGTYRGQEEDVPTFGVKILLCVSADMDEELAYELAKALASNGEDLASANASLAAMKDPAFLSMDLPIPLHPGAKRYYQESGYYAESGRLNETDALGNPALPGGGKHQE